MKQRVITAATLIPLVLIVVFIENSWPIYALALVAFCIGAGELGNLGSGSRRWHGVVGLLAVLSVAGVYAWSLGFGPFAGYRPGPSSGRDFLAVSSVQLTLIGVIALLGFVRGLRGAWIVEGAALWIAGGLVALLSLHDSQAQGWTFRWSTPLLLALIPLWIGDTLAIFVGRAWGKHLLAPKVSPKKTVEGGIANLVGCLIGAIGITALIGQPLAVGIASGLATGILGQAGDLLESAMKRSASVKDSGSLLPGHGGLLDRIDSVLLSAPAVALIVVLLGSHA